MSGAARADLVAVGPQDWERWRALRLEALQDTPIGFVRTHAESAALGESDRRAWLARPGGFWLLVDRQAGATTDRPSATAACVRRWS